MAEKARHLGMWWCACGCEEPRPRGTALEESRLAWWDANGDPARMCGCPIKYSRFGGGTKEHTDGCQDNRDEGLREKWDIDGLKARSKSGARLRCPSYGSRIVQAMVPGARFPN